MRLPNRKSQLERFVESVTNSLDMPSGIKSGLPGAGSGKAKKAGLIAGGLAGLTAGSAAISSLRRRKEGARDGS